MAVVAAVAAEAAVVVDASLIATTPVAEATRLRSVEEVAAATGVLKAKSPRRTLKKSPLSRARRPLLPKVSRHHPLRKRSSSVSKSTRRFWLRSVLA